MDAGHQASKFGTVAVFTESGRTQLITDGISLEYCDAISLLRPSHSLLPVLAKHFLFESAIGANGVLWIHTSDPKHFVAAKLVLEAADDAAATGLGKSPLSRPEKTPAEWGRRLASQWGAIPTSFTEADVGNIVNKVIGL